MTTSGVVHFRGSPQERLCEYLEQQQHTEDAIRYYLAFSRDVRRHAESTVRKDGRLLHRLFTALLIDEPGLGLRPITLPELLRPDQGRLLFFYLRKALEELHERAALEMLQALRRFCRFICENGAQLPSGVNLRRRWGPLVCPIVDRDLEKRKPDRGVSLPRIEQMPAIYEVVIDWAENERQSWTGWRTATAFIVACGSGMRGVELRRSRLADQLFDRSKGLEGLLNPLNVRGAKKGPDRRAQVEPFEFEILRYWLSELRPQRAGDDLRGFLLPSSSGPESELASSSLSETSKRLIDHLKRRGLLDARFTFHSTRKTYATHFLERKGTDVDALLQQCGWGSPALLGTYVRPSADSVAEQQERFARTVGLRGGRT